MQKWRVHGDPRITIPEAKQIYHLMDLNEYQFLRKSCNYMHNLFDQGTMICYKESLKRTATGNHVWRIRQCTDGHSKA